MQFIEDSHLRAKLFCENVGFYVLAFFAPPGDPFLGCFVFLLPPEKTFQKWVASQTKSVLSQIVHGCIARFAPGTIFYCKL